MRETFSSADPKNTVASRWPIAATLPSGPPAGLLSLIVCLPNDQHPFMPRKKTWSGADWLMFGEFLSALLS